MLASHKSPVLFIGHGNPMNTLDKQNVFNQGLVKISKTFVPPKVILMISAHWYSGQLQVQSAQQPPMIYDFYGFPDKLYQVDYPAKGSPKLAQRITHLLADEGIIQNDKRSYDHGAWTVLKHLYPDADIPVVQLSLNRTQSIKWHWHLAQKLKPLRDEGVLIIGSGNIVHHLGAIDWRNINTLGAGFDWAFAFKKQINQAIKQRDQHTLMTYEQLGEPAQLSVPTVEHYLPLLYVMALAEADEPISLFNDELVGGSLSMTSVKVG